MTSSRYDAIADWYVEFTRDWPSEPVALLPGNLRGQHVVDLACGYGTAGRYLAGRGAVVTAVDLSTKMLDRAVTIEGDAPSGVRYVHGDVTTIDWWDGEPFDGAVSNMALMDVDDLDGALATAAKVVKSGGWYSMSVLHP